MTDQSTRNQRAAPARSPYQAAPAWYDTHPADHPTADADAAHEAAVDDTAVDEQRVDRSAADEPGSEEAAGHFAGVTPHAATEPQADLADHGDVNTPDGGAPGDNPNGRYGVEESPVDAATAVHEPQAGQRRDDPLDDVHGRGGVIEAEVPLVAAPTADVPGIATTGSGQLLPGDVSQEPVTALLDGTTADRFRDRWQQLQLRFIDDPKAVAAEAGVLVDEVVTALHDAVDQRRSALEDGPSGDGVDAHAADTERLRMAVRRYRVFLDHLLGR